MSTRSDVALLCRRLGFAATAAELDAAEAAGFDQAAHALLAPAGADPGVVATPPPTLSYHAPSGKLDIPSRMAAEKVLQTETAALRAWWIRRMVLAQQPLRERMALFWHGHFATSASKVRQAVWMQGQNAIFRTEGLGAFDALVSAVGKGPAMQVWLDTQTNTAANPNENFARELMELFTLGPGNYTEADVRAGARAFTGWSFVPATGQFRVVVSHHDTGSKTFLGTTADLDGDDVVRIVTHLPACARFVTARVWSRLVAPASAGDTVIARVAPSSPPDIGDLMARVASSLRTSAAPLVAEPVPYVVGVLRQLGLDPTSFATPAAQAAGDLGQQLFDPPNVGGWPSGQAWLSSSTAAARLAFARRCAHAADLSAIADTPARGRRAAVARLLSLPDGFGPQTTAALTAAGGDPEVLLTVALVSPEYVLR